MRNILEKLKIFNINPSKLRTKNWYENTFLYHEYCLNKFSNIIKKPNQFACPLCGGERKKKFLARGKYLLFDCLKCSLVSANVNVDKFDTQEAYDSKESGENTKRNILSTYNYRKKTYAVERLNYLLEKIKLHESKLKLLDVGCGSGYFIDHLKDKKIKYKGLELSNFLIDICRKKKLNVSNTDVSQEPNNYYNVVTMFDVLEHLVDPISFLKKLNQKIVRGGYILAYTPNIHSVAFLLMKEKQNLLSPFQHLCFYDKESLNFLAQKTGFNVHSIDYYGLDLTDYFLMKQYEDGFDYLSKISESIPILQAIIDKQKLSNHMRVIFKKSF